MNVIDINVCQKRWYELDQDISKFMQNIINAIPNLEHKTISLLLTDDDDLQELNKKYRDKDKPTNVLSFPYEGAPDGTIGDIALSFETIKMEAEAANLCFKKHTAHMIIHGVLHLLGYTHDHDEDAQLMEGLEEEILSKLHDNDVI